MQHIRGCWQFFFIFSVIFHRLGKNIVDSRPCLPKLRFAHRQKAITDVVRKRLSPARRKNDIYKDEKETQGYLSG